MRLDNKDQIEFILKDMGVKYEKEFRFIPGRKFRADFYLPDYKCLVEYEGIFSSKSRHTNIVGYSNDCFKYAMGSLLGYTIIRITAIMLNNGQAIELIEKLITGNTNA